MEKVARYVGVAVEGLCKVLLVIQILTVSWVVFGRYVLNKTPRWGEELGLMTMVWFGLLSASLAIRSDSHLRLSLLDMILSKKNLKVVEWFVTIAVIGFACFLIWSGIQLVELTSSNRLSGIRISSAWLYLAVPVSGVAMLAQLLDKARKLR
ncbi:MAG: TRAP transporter small permease [Bacillota bacterium]